jgi:hypothetical protein
LPIEALVPTISENIVILRPKETAMFRKCATAALITMAFATGAAPADVFIRVPFFSFSVGPRGCPTGPAIRVYVPGIVDVQVRPRGRVIVPERPVREEIPPVKETSLTKYDRVQPPPPEPYAASPKGLTLAEFAGSFQPAAGPHEAVLIHPVSKAPVKVRFTLPAGTPRKVRVHRRELVFDYGRQRVKVRFVADGNVRVIAR